MNKTIRKIVIAIIAIITIVSVSGITPASAQVPAELIRAQINVLLAQVTALQAQLAGITASTSAFNFTRDLSVGSTGEDVRALQRFLNARGFTVATTGAGSPGNETAFFGLRTQTALARFQSANNIFPANGFFDSITRGRVMGLATVTSAFNFTRDLTVGSVGEDVRALQRFLNARGFTVATTGAGSSGNETTFFCFQTQTALARFQSASNIFPANGFFDSATRARITALTTPVTPVSSFNFTRDLTIGSVGEDVRVLQQFLNARGFTVVATGAGSPGNETTFFCFQTQSALARFQSANNIFPANGFFDSITRGTIMELAAVAPAFNFTRDLSVGSTGEDVRALQRFLNARGFTVATTGAGSPGNETTFFCFQTQSALARFQSANNIFPANGFLDSVTRARITALTTPVAHTPVFNFNRDLTIGSVGEDVRALQQFLNSRGFTVVATGAGSPSNETTFFCFQTQSALARFQSANNIFPANGFFDSVTRGRIMFLIVPATSVIPAPNFNFTRDLTIGSVGEDVRALQQFLNSRGFTVVATGAGSPSNETTFFCFWTQTALARFQSANNIFPANGLFDLITRGRIMALIVPTAPAPAPIVPGVLASAISPATPASVIVPAGATGRVDIPVTIVRYTATNEPVILQDITVNPITTRRSTITSVEIVDGTRIISMPVPATGAIVFRNVNIEIPANTHRDIIVRADLAGTTPGVITRFRRSDLIIELDVQVTRAHGRNSGASITTGLSNITGGNPIIVRQSLPIVTKLSNSTTFTGANSEVLRFTVTADPRGNIELRTLTVAFSEAIVRARLYEGTTLISTGTGTTSVLFDVVNRPEKNIVAGTTRTFTVRADVAWVTASLSASILANETGFVWRDANGSESTGELVPSLPITGDRLRRLTIMH